MMTPRDRDTSSGSDYSHDCNNDYTQATILGFWMIYDDYTYRDSILLVGSSKSNTPDGNEDDSESGCINSSSSSLSVSSSSQSQSSGHLTSI